MKGVAEICGVAESKGVGDILDRHFRIAQIFHRDVGSQLIHQFTKGRSLFTQLAAQRTGRDTQSRRDIFETGVPSNGRQQQFAHFSSDADPVRQFVLEVVAQAKDGRVGNFITKMRRTVQPCRIEE